MKKSVDRYIISHANWQKELSLLRDILRDLALEEGIKWGAPVYMLNGKNVVGLGAFKSYVGLWFFQGVLLTDKNKVLHNAQEGKTQSMRQWRFRNLAEIDHRNIIEYVSEAIDNQKQGRVIKPTKKKTITIPQELSEILDRDSNLLVKFNQLTPYKQKEYYEYINEAKRVTTKESRLIKIKPMIMAGQGLNDRYR